MPRPRPGLRRASARRALRRPATYWAVAASLALLTGWSVAQATTAARDLRSAYGTTTEVVVTIRAVAAGEPLADAVETRPHPAGLVPEGALDRIDPTMVASAPLTAGTVVTEPAVSSGAWGDERSAAIALPVTAMTPPAPPGAAVLIVVGADPLGAVDATLITGRVVARDELQVLVAVERDRLPDAAAAVAAGNAVLAIAGG